MADFPVAKVKQEGLGLDFSRIREAGTRALVPGDAYRLKTYGFCQQKHPGYFTLRIRIPGGVVTAHQLHHLAQLIETHGRGAAHLTFRQGLELHFVRVEEMEEIFKSLQSIGMTTRSTDGHTLRNVVACPHGGIDPAGVMDVLPWAEWVSSYFVNQSESLNPMMPNRLNIAFLACPSCNPYAAVHDIAFVAVASNPPTGGSEWSLPVGRSGHADVVASKTIYAKNSDVANRETPYPSGQQKQGFELWVGGSLSGTHPFLGIKLIDFVPLSDVLPACQAVFAIYTKFGHPVDPEKSKGSRLKYLIEQWGQDQFSATFNKVFMEKKGLPENQSLSDHLPKATDNGPIQIKRFFEEISQVFPFQVPEGARQKQKGYAYLKIAVPLGEIRTPQLVELGRIASQYGDGKVHFTPHQDIELHWIPIRKIRQVTEKLRGIQLALKGGQNSVDVVACPGTEFCVLASANAQGTARELLRHFKSDNPDRMALFQSLSIHISGCPNGCAKHYLGDIGLAGEVGADSDRYAYKLYLGGTVSAETRLGEVVCGGVTEEWIIPAIDALLAIVLEHRQLHETFCEVVARVGTRRIAELLENKITDFQKEKTEELILMPNMIMDGP
jgi:sulfite reductase beta subunit-like hemoprotein